MISFKEKMLVILQGIALYKQQPASFMLLVFILFVENHLKLSFVTR